MAEPTDVYPEAATRGDQPRETGNGEAALREVLDEHGEELAAAIEQTDELGDLLETAILMVATADEDEIEYLTESSANLVHAVDGVSTEEAAALADDVGDNADDLADALETVLALQRGGDLNDLTAIATAFSGSLSAAEIEELATLLEENGSETVQALDVVLELQREDRLEDLVELASTLSTLEIDAETARGLNTMLSAVGEAERTAEPVGVLGLFGQLRSGEGRAGLGYVVALLRALGRRVRPR